MLVGQDAGDIRKQAGAVERLDLDRNQEDEASDGAHSTSIIRSGSVAQVREVQAVGAMHGDAGSAGDEAQDLVARYRGAALGQAHPDVGCALDPTPESLAAPGLRRGDFGGMDDLGQVLLRAGRAADRATSFSTTDWA